MFSLLLKSSIVKNEINREAHDLYQKRVNQEKERKLESLVLISDMSIGKPIIMISDSDNPISVGIITGFMQLDPQIPYVYDYIQNREIVCFSKYINYNDKNLETVMKLTPSEICNLFLNFNIETEDGYEVKSSNKHNLTIDEIKKKLADSDFLEKARDFWK